MSSKTEKNRKKRQRKAARKRTAARKLVSALATAEASGKGAYVVRKRKPVVRGSGAYFAPDYFERLGDHFLGSTGKVLGEGVGGLLKAFGLGKYDLEQNSLLEKVTMDPGDDVPRIRNDNRGEGFLIQHEEYIGDLYTPDGGGPTVFAIDTYNLNPANSNLFPWLSTVATNFEEWSPKGIIFTLKTMASDVSTALSLGMMFGAVQYDALDDVFANKEELLNYEGANSVKVSHSAMIPVECKPSLDTLTHLYVKPGNLLPEGADTRFYDLGNVSFGTSGCPESLTPVAEIWVSYEIAFFKPKLTAGGDLQLLWQSAHYDLTTGFAPATAFMGTNPTFIAGKEDAFTLSNVANKGRISFNPQQNSGAYFILFNILGSAATITAPTITGSTSCVAQSGWLAGGSSARGAQTGLAGQTLYSFAFWCYIIDVDAYIEISGGTLPGTPSAVDMFITQVNYDVLNL